MTNAKDLAEQAAGDQPASPEGGLDVQLVRELIDRAKAEGVSLVGPGGLLAGVTKTVLQAALDAAASRCSKLRLNARSSAIALSSSTAVLAFSVGLRPGVAVMSLRAPR
jgi:hypothetical protein